MDDILEMVGIGLSLMPTNIVRLRLLGIEHDDPERA